MGDRIDISSTLSCEKNERIVNQCNIMDVYIIPFERAKFMKGDCDYHYSRSKLIVQLIFRNHSRLQAKSRKYEVHSLTTSQIL